MGDPVKIFNFNSVQDGLLSPNFHLYKLPDAEFNVGIDYTDVLNISDLDLDEQSIEVSAKNLVNKSNASEEILGEPELTFNPKEEARVVNIPIKGGEANGQYLIKVSVKTDEEESPSKLVSCFKLKVLAEDELFQPDK